MHRSALPTALALLTATSMFTACGGNDGPSNGDGTAGSGTTGSAGSDAKSGEDDDDVRFDDLEPTGPDPNAPGDVELVSFDNVEVDGGIVLGPGVGVPDIDFVYERPAPEETEACASVEAGATLTTLPVDIVFVIDNSSSMGEEIAQVEAQINDNFASIIGASGLDYRVIMVSRYGDVDATPPDIGGSDFPICISGALGGTDCASPNTTQLVNNAPLFYHYSADVESRNSWCVLLEGLTTSDELSLNNGLGTRPFAWTPLAPNGYQEWLRTEAVKSFVVISDDSPGANGCTAYADSEAGAMSFDAALRGAAPEQFGAYDAGDPALGRRYRWYSIVGFNGSELLQPEDDVVGGTCDVGGNTGENSGTGYQYLSKLSGGLRFPSCQTDEYSTVFNEIAQGVIEGAQVACDFAIPNVTGIIDPEQVQVEYLPGGDASLAIALTRASADEVANCATNQFVLTDYVAGQPTRIALCPDACAQVQNDLDAEITIDFGCLGS